MAPLTPGTQVVLQGLQSAAELNGKVANILEVAEEKGRYQVRVVGAEGRKLAVKYECARLAEKDEVDEARKEAVRSLSLSLSSSPQKQSVD